MGRVHRGPASMAESKVEKRKQWIWKEKRRYAHQQQLTQAGKSSRT